MTCRIAKRVGAVLKRTGKPIVFRRIVSTGGANPASNPVTGAITVATAAGVGASAVTLNAPAGNWFLEAGDVLAIGANTVTVAARTVSASGKFTAVPITPALGADITGGQSVAVTWVNDFPCKAIVGSFEQRLIDGTTVKVGDTRVMMQTTDSSGRSIPKPTALDKIIMDGVTRSIVTAGVEYAGADPAVFDVQARG